jgi:hypothetical protein
VQALRGWSAQQWACALAAALVAAALLGLATGSVPNPLTFRQLPLPWWGYPLWGLSAALAGLLAASYLAPVPHRDVEGKATLGGLLSVFALGCPICNKLVLLALGASGALAWFAPIQPLLAVLSVVLLGWALHRRLRAAAACPAAGTGGTGGGGEE